MIEVKCAHCGNLFQRYPSRTNKRFCSRSCADKGKNRAPSKKVDRICEKCGCSFSVYPSEAGVRRFCSRECAREVNAGKSPANKGEHIPITCDTCGNVRMVIPAEAKTARYCSRKCANIGRRKDEPTRVDCTCEMCGGTFSRKPFDAKTARFCSRDCHNAHKRTITGVNHPLYKPKVPMDCEFCGKTRQVKPSLVSRFRFCSRRCAGAWVSQTWPRTSSIERMVHKELAARGIRFETEVQVGHFLVDIAFPALKLAVEVDGTYWHSLPKQVAKDRMKDGWLKKSGWKIIRLPESDIHEDVKACVDIIEHRLPRPTQEPLSIGN